MPSVGEIYADVGLKIDNSGLTSATSMFKSAESSLTGLGNTAKTASLSVGSQGFGAALEQMNTAMTGVTASSGAAKFGAKGFSDAISAMGTTATASGSALTGLSFGASSAGTAFTGLGTTATAASNTISGKLTAGISKVGTSLTGLASKSSTFQTLSSGAKSAGYALSDLTQKSTALKNEMGTMGTVITSVVTGTLVKGLTDVISVYASFDDQMRQVSAVTSATGEQFTQLSEEAKQLGADTSFTAQEVAEGMTILGQSGFDATEVMQAMPGTLDLARASMTGLTTSVDILRTTMTGFRMEADQTSEASDIIAKAANISATDVTGIGEAMKYTSSLAHEMDWTLEETTAAIGELSNAGIKNSMAGTVLRNSITRLIAPTKNVIESLEKYGISLDDINPETHKLADILDLLAVKGVKTGDIMKIFGMRAGPGMLALLSQGGQGLRDYTEQLENADGYAEQAAETMDAGLGGAIRQLEGSIETLKITLGEDLSYSLENVIRLSAKLLNVYELIPSPIRKVAAALLAMATAGLVVVSGLGAMGLIIEAAGPALGVLGITAASTSAALTGIVGPAAAVAVGLIYLDEKTGIISETLSILYDMWTIDWYFMKSVVGSVINTISGYIDGLTSDLSELGVDLHLDGITNYFSGFKTAIGGFVEDVHGMADDCREANEEMKYTVDDTGNTVLDVSDIAQSANEDWMESSGLLASAVIGDNDEMQGSLEKTKSAYEKAVEDMFTESNAKEAAGIQVMSKGVSIDELSRGIKTLSGDLIILNDANDLVKVSADGTVTTLKELGDQHFDTTKGGLDVLIGSQDSLKTKTDEADRIIQNTNNDVVVLSDSVNTVGESINGLPNQPIMDIVNQVSGLKSGLDDTNSATFTFGSSLVSLNGIKLTPAQIEASTLGSDINTSKNYSDQLNYSLGKTDMIPMGQILSNQISLGGGIDQNTGKTGALNTQLGNTNNIPMGGIQSNLSASGSIIDSNTSKTSFWNWGLNTVDGTPFGTVKGNLSSAGILTDANTSKTGFWNTGLGIVISKTFGTLFGNLGTSGTMVDTDNSKTGNWNSTLGNTNNSPFGTLFGNLGTTGVNLDNDKKKADGVNGSLSTLGGFSFSTTISSLGSVYNTLGNIYDRAVDTIKKLSNVGSSSGSLSSSSSSNHTSNSSSTTNNTNYNYTTIKTNAVPSNVTAWVKRATGN